MRLSTSCFSIGRDCETLPPPLAQTQLQAFFELGERPAYRRCILVEYALRIGNTVGLNDGEENAQPLQIAAIEIHRFAWLA
jgi:hypothetical protein